MGNKTIKNPKDGDLFKRDGLFKGPFNKRSGKSIYVTIYHKPLQIRTYKLIDYLRCLLLGFTQVNTHLLSSELHHHEIDLNNKKYRKYPEFKKDLLEDLKTIDIQEGGLLLSNRFKTKSEKFKELRELSVYKITNVNPSKNISNLTLDVKSLATGNEYKNVHILEFLKPIIMRFKYNYNKNYTNLYIEPLKREPAAYFYSKKLESWHELNFSSLSKVIEAYHSFHDVYTNESFVDLNNGPFEIDGIAVKVNPLNKSWSLKTFKHKVKIHFYAMDMIYKKMKRFYNNRSNSSIDGIKNIYGKIVDPLYHFDSFI